MASVVATCPKCHFKNTLRPSEVTVLTEFGKNAGSYEYQCYKCLEYVETKTTQRNVENLINIGCEHRVTGAPLEVFERPAASSKITEDEITEFCKGMGTEEWMKRFTEGA